MLLLLDRVQYMVSDSKYDINFIIYKSPRKQILCVEN
jgi:hypothetical protein